MAVEELWSFNRLGFVVFNLKGFSEGKKRWKELGFSASFATIWRNGLQVEASQLGIIMQRVQKKV